MSAASQLQLRRGNTAQHAVFTGAPGEVTVDTDKKTVVVHDGSTQGGFPLARADQVVNVIDYGADPTGISDSASAIQAANDYAYANQCGATYFPCGYYRCTTQLIQSSNWIGARGRSVPGGPSRGWGTSPATLGYDGEGNESFITNLAIRPGETFTQQTFISMQSLALMPHRRNVGLGISSILPAGGEYQITTTGPHAASVGSFVTFSNGTTGTVAAILGTTVVSVLADYTAPTGSSSVSMYAPRYLNGIDQIRRIDSGLAFRDVWISQAANNGIEFHRGLLNGNLRDLRFDGCNGFGIKVNVFTAGDSFSVDGLYVENGGSNGGGGVCIDHSQVAPGTGTTVTAYVENAVLEMNVPQKTGHASLKLVNSPTNPQYVQTNLILDNVAGGGGATQRTSLLVSPAHEGCRIQARNAEVGTIVGLPGVIATPRTATTTSKRNLNFVYQPLTPSMQQIPGAESSEVEISSDIAAANYYVEGLPVVPLLAGTTTDPSYNAAPKRLKSGAWFFDPAASNAEIRVVTEVLPEAFLGTLTGITASGSAGSPNLALSGSDSEILKIRRGYALSIGGSETRRIASIDYENKTAVLTSALSSAHSNATAQFPVPLTRSHQLLSKRFSYPSTGTFTKGHVLVNDNPAISGTSQTVVGWLRLTTGSGNVLGTDWAALHATTQPNIVSASTPSSAPAFAGQIYIDTGNDTAYIATGTASAADWKAISHP